MQKTNGPKLGQSLGQMTWSKSAGNALTYATKLTQMLQVLQQLNKFMFSKQKGHTETKYTETMTWSKLAANALELSNQDNNNAHVLLNLNKWNLRLRQWLNQNQSLQLQQHGNTNVSSSVVAEQVIVH